MSWHNLPPEIPIYYEDGSVVLINADCRDILPLLPKVDLVLTDPPYGIGFDYGGYDDSPEDYESLIKAVVDQSIRLVDGGMCFFWQSMLNADKWHRWFPPGFRIFACCKGFVHLRHIEVQYAWDPVIFWGTTSTKSNKSIRDWHIISMPNFGGGRISIQHPCPRPLPQVKYIIEGLPRADTILDPFCGSGTTLVAAKQLGRKAIGVEISEAYCKIAVERLKQEILI